MRPSPRMKAVTMLTHFAIAATLLAGGSADAGDCNELLRLGYRNIEENSSAAMSRQFARADFCSEDYEKASADKKMKIEAAYGPFSGGAATSESNIRTAQKKVCWSKDESAESASSSSNKAVTIHDQALDAWNKCNALAAKQLATDVSLMADLAGVTVQMTWRGANSVRFTGLNVVGVGTRAACTVQTPALPKAEAAGPNTRFDLKAEATATFSCSREFNAKPAPKSADQVRLTFTTEVGSLDVDLPAVRLVQVPVVELAALAARVEQVEKKHSTLTNALSSLGIECHTASATSAVTPYSVAVATIPAADAQGATVVSGGCTTGLGKNGHNAILLESKPVANGWHCKSGDQANLSTPVATTATVVYCRAKPTTQSPGT